ncbi:hypothetical protein L596_028946 [Steinernema carpocapsae]|uniref:Uncharacterized protein n=1 Tax=Steinernema carpocapsae TaxID=34508 RepID=A0A4U5LZT9_STECR|nr:hypothetical protein L596_028946 [Steinernema carpocapsae]
MWLRLLILCFLPQLVVEVKADDFDIVSILDPHADGPEPGEPTNPNAPGGINYQPVEDVVNSVSNGVEQEAADHFNPDSDHVNTGDATNPSGSEGIDHKPVQYAVNGRINYQILQQDGEAAYGLDPHLNTLQPDGIINPLFNAVQSVVTAAPGFDQPAQNFVNTVPKNVKDISRVIKNRMENRSGHQEKVRKFLK